MPKEITAFATQQMSNKMGISMSFIVETRFGTFSTKETPGAKGTISSLGNCTVEKRSDNLGSSGNLNVTIVDDDGATKFLINSLDVEGSYATVYEVFDGGEGTDWIPLLKGKITGPLTWSEGNREVSFGIEATAWSQPAGFAPTSLDFPDLAPESYGSPWPMIFGTATHVPAVRARRYAAGSLHTDIKLYTSKGYDLNKTTNSFTTDVNVYVKTVLESSEVTNTLLVKGGAAFPQQKAISIIIDGVVFKGQFDGEVFTVSYANAPKYENLQIDSRDSQDVDYKNTAVLWVKKLDNGMFPNLVGHHCYFNTTANITWYNFCTAQSNGKCTFRSKFICPTLTDSQVVDGGDSSKAKGWELLMSTGKSIKSAYQISRNGLRADVEKIVYQLRDITANRPHNTGQSTWGLVIKAIDRARESADGFWSAYADTEVRLWNQEDPDIYVFSCVPCSQILGVYGKKNVKFMNGKTKKITTPIPKAYYTEQLQSNYRLPATGDFASALIFKIPLSNYKTSEGAEEWEDTIYVSAVSTVGPNTADIIEYLLSSYTDLSLNQASFSRARNKVNAWPANFAVFDRQDALKLCQDIAWQARCALLTENGRAELLFVAEKPAGLFIFNTTNVNHRSVNEDYTPITEIKTRILGTWTPSYEDAGSPDRHNDSTTNQLRHIIRGLNADDDHKTRTATELYPYEENVYRYGEQTEDRNIFIYNNEDSVAICLQFWGHRMANSWKFIDLQGFHDSLGLTIFDGVEIDLPGFPSIRGVIESARFDPKSKLINYRIWLPIVAGSLTEDSGAWNG